MKYFFISISFQSFEQLLWTIFTQQLCRFLLFREYAQCLLTHEIMRVLHMSGDAHKMLLIVPCGHPYLGQCCAVVLLQSNSAPRCVSGDAVCPRECCASVLLCRGGAVGHGLLLGMTPRPALSTVRVSR